MTPPMSPSACITWPRSCSPWASGRRRQRIWYRPSSCWTGRRRLGFPEQTKALTEASSGHLYSAMQRSVNRADRWQIDYQRGRRDLSGEEDVAERVGFEPTKRCRLRHFHCRREDILPKSADVRPSRLGRRQAVFWGMDGRHPFAEVRLSPRSRGVYCQIYCQPAVGAPWPAAAPSACNRAAPHCSHWDLAGRRKAWSMCRARRQMSDRLVGGGRAAPIQLAVPCKAAAVNLNAGMWSRYPPTSTGKSTVAAPGTAVD